MNGVDEHLLLTGGTDVPARPCYVGSVTRRRRNRLVDLDRTAASRAEDASDWRALLETASERAIPRALTLCFVIDLDSGGARPRVDWTASEPVVSVVLATRNEDGVAVRKLTPLTAPPRGPDAAGAAGVMCQLSRAARSPVVSLGRPAAERLLLDLCRAGQLFGVEDDDLDRAIPLRATNAAPWQLRLEAENPDDESAPIELVGRLRRLAADGPESIALSRVDRIIETGFVVVGDELGLLEASATTWLVRLRSGPVAVPRAELAEFLGALAATPNGPFVANIEELGYDEHALTPIPVLRLAAPEPRDRAISGRLTFLYRSRSGAGNEPDGIEVGGERIGAHLVEEGRRVLRRNFGAEERAVQALRDVGFSVSTFTSDTAVCPHEVRVHVNAFAHACEALLDQGFVIEAEGAVYRRPTRWRTVCASDQDWFELEARVGFGAAELELPALLSAVRKNQRFVRLGDGSLGVLPEKWLADLSPLAALVNPRSKLLRFHAAQALMIDGLLPRSWQLEVDAGFEQMRQRLQGFAGVTPRNEPTAFQGTLRAYQRAALGWIDALSQLGLGGCLADDMGLGKTVVVLAWLLSRAEQGHGPSLVVVPKSLIFNWRAEARTFAPSLRVLVHHDTGRLPPGDHFYDQDVVITSYGTLRKDARALGRITFDYVVVDEAHNIKNRDTETHRVARSVPCRFRLALTGTPLENHLRELWSLMTFLNPSVFEPLHHLEKTFERKRPSDIALTESITRAIRPFLLRRTKAEAAPELPARIEKTVYIELGKAQRRLYQDLAAHYRARILDRKERRRHSGPSRFGTASGGNGHQAAEALAALLRLRQVACHPGLLDSSNDALEAAHEPFEEIAPRRKGSPFSLDAPEVPRCRRAPPPVASAKLEILVPELRSLQSEGHKSLVFSQFRGLLDLLACELDAAGVRYEKLDGRTRRREQVVARFDRCEGACTFLISLKAGGVGLNLTAADYVFILDPWWNPAAESQAIDRAHRIGQDRPVIAYRLLAEDTVETRVAALQSKKRALVDALFAETSGFSEGITREDLEFLLGSLD